MKEIFIFLTMTFLVFSVKAQQMEEGVLKYNIEFSSEDPKIAAILPMLEGASLTKTFKENRIRFEINMGVLSGDEVIIVNLNSIPQKLVLQDNNEKIATQQLEIEKIDSISKSPFEIEVSDEEKYILGFKCRKVHIFDENSGNEMIFWLTKEISKPLILGLGEIYREDLPGVPLVFESYQDNLHMVFTISEITNELPRNQDKLFSTEPPEGYRLISD